MLLFIPVLYFILDSFECVFPYSQFIFGIFVFCMFSVGDFGLIVST